MKYLAAVLTAKNERPIIAEWMAFHRAAGVEHLFVIDNGSGDGMADIVRAFPDPASVTYLSRPERKPQTELYDEILRTYGIGFEWMAFIDADEFLYPTDGGDLRDTLAGFPEAAAIGVHWLIYGSAGHLTPPGGLVIENFTRRSENNFTFNRHVKSIVRPARRARAITSHVFQVDGPFVDEAGRALHLDPPHGFFEDRVASQELLRINHYHVRSRADYEAKAGKGYFGVDDAKLQGSVAQFEAMYAAHDRNEIEDRSACAYIPRMRRYLPTG